MNIRNMFFYKVIILNTKGLNVISKALIFVFLPYYITKCNTLIINKYQTTIDTIKHNRIRKKERTQ